MVENFRSFEVGPDSFGRTWKIRFLWQQNGLSIRHADTVDVKFSLSAGDHEENKVIALANADLRRLAGELVRPISDAWVSRLAATHLKKMVESGEDMDKTLIAPNYEELKGWVLKSARPQPK